MSQKNYNIFISYGWADNEGDPGWVSTFVDKLRSQLGRELPRLYVSDGIWLDYEQLRGSDRVTASIRAKLETSRILIPIISRSYLDSPWCREELRIFLKLHGPDSERIFPVWMSPTDDQPPPLDDLLKYKFWYKDDRQKPRTRWFPDIDGTDREYGRLQQDMARDLAAQLVKIWHDEPEAPVVEPSPRPVARPHGDDHLVLVNGGDKDATLVQEVADRLHHNHNIGAITPLSVLQDQTGLKSSDITRDLRDKLKLCTAMLIVYKNGPVHQINRQITEFLKVIPQRPKDRPTPTLDLCHPKDRTMQLGMYLPQMRDCPCGGDSAADWARNFVEGLT